MPLSTSSDNLHRLIYKTRFGNGMLVWRGKCCWLSLPGKQGDQAPPGDDEKFFAARRTGHLVQDTPGRARATPDEKKLVHLLESYFSGKRVDFSKQELFWRQPARRRSRPAFWRRWR